MPKIGTTSKVSLKLSRRKNLGRRGAHMLISRLWTQPISSPTALKEPNTKKQRQWRPPNTPNPGPTRRQTTTRRRPTTSPGRQLTGPSANAPAAKYRQIIAKYRQISLNPNIKLLDKYRQISLRPMTHPTEFQALSKEDASKIKTQMR